MPDGPVNGNVLTRSVETLPTKDQAPLAVADSGWGILSFVTQGLTEIPAWGTLIQRRDALLRELLPTEPFAAGAFASVVSRYASFSWTIKGPNRPRTTALSQQMLLSANHGRGWVDFAAQLTLDLLCLAATSKVTLGGDRRGKLKAIRDIVRERDPGPVLTVGPSGQIEERPIVEWHRSPLGRRQWIWISAEHVSGHTRSDPGGLYLTDDHPVLTRDGWLQAGAIRVGM